MINRRPFIAIPAPPVHENREFFHSRVCEISETGITLRSSNRWPARIGNDVNSTQFWASTSVSFQFASLSLAKYVILRRKTREILLFLPLILHEMEHITNWNTRWRWRDTGCWSRFRKRMNKRRCKLTRIIAREPPRWKSLKLRGGNLRKCFRFNGFCFSKFSNKFRVTRSSYDAKSTICTRALFKRR